MNKIKKLVLILAFLLLSNKAYSGDITRPHIFIDGEVLTAALLNTEIDTVVSEVNDLDGDNLASNIAITTSGACTFSGTNTLSGATTVSGTFATTGNTTLGNGADTLTINSSSGITYTPAATWIFTGAQTVSGTWANLGTVTTVDINGGSIDGVTIGAAAAPTVTNLGAVTTADINGGTLDGVIIGGASAAAITCTTLTTGGKLTAGANEIEGSNFDITGGTITGITDLAVADGGTGAGTFTDGGILLGSGTDAITPMGVLANGTIVIGDGTTDPTTLAAFSSSTGTLATTYGGTGVATDDRIVSGWVNFQGSSTINDSYNVDSVTDNDVGDYTITWTTDFASINYAVAGCAIEAGSTAIIVSTNAALTAGTTRIGVRNVNNTLTDTNPVFLIAIGNR